MFHISINNEMMRMKYQSIAAVLIMALSFVMVPHFMAFAESEPLPEAAEVVAIDSLDDLAAMADAPNGSYRLMKDLDMSALDWQPIAFSGTLDGAGHTLYNLKVSHAGSDIRETRDGNLKQYDTEFAGLFSAVENGTIENLNIVGAEIAVENATNCFTAVLAGYVNRSTISGCSVSGRVHMVSHGVNVGIAGIAGYGCGNFAQCGAEVELVFEDRYSDGSCEEFMGGVLACGIGNITNCSVKIDGWDSCSGYVHNGGLVGMYYDCNLKVRAGLVNDNAVVGQITFFENNPDRRAYCKAYIGESLTGPAAMAGNTSDFQNNETADYSAVLLPEQCAAPHYAEIVTPSGCREWGYTEHRCMVCGYHWRDRYTPPAHTAGEWVIIRAADDEHEGLRQQYCAVCGELLAEEHLPIMTEQTKSSGSGRVRWLLWGLIPLILLIPPAAALAISVYRKNKKTFVLFK